MKLWRAHWAEFTPFLACPPEVRRVIYTTNLIESMNARLRKVTRNRGQFPSEQAALKVLYPAVRNLEEFRSPNVGIRSSGWQQALQGSRPRYTWLASPAAALSSHRVTTATVPAVPGMRQCACEHGL